MTEGRSHLQTPIPVVVREGRYYIDGGSDEGYTTRDKAIAAVGLTPVTSRGDVSRREVSQTNEDLMDELEGATVDDSDAPITGDAPEPDAPETDPNPDDSDDTLPPVDAEPLEMDEPPATDEKTDEEGGGQDDADQG